MNSCRFPREARVRARAEFDRVFQDGRRTGSAVFGLHWIRAEHAPRLGLAVSRKVDRRAVGRNRIKRCLRDAFRHIRADLVAGDYVVVARPAAAAQDAAALREAFLELLRRVRALPAREPVGTMPPPSSSPSAAAFDPPAG